MTRRRFALAAALLLAVAAGVAAFILWQRPPAADPVAAAAANTRGVGLVERYDYPAAETEFAAAVRLAPDWLPARINLGIAQFNRDNPEALARARATFAAVLARSPGNAHAHYCLGIIASERGPYPEAYPHFQQAHAADPDDAHTLLRLGMTHPDGKDSAAARDLFERALKRSPYLNAARYQLALALRDTDPARSDALLAEKKALSDANWELEAGIRYGEMGKYADVIGRDPAARPPVGPLPVFAADAAKVTLAAGTTWAGDAGGAFGGTVVLFDYNGDGKPDVFLASAVVENGKKRDLLLRNDGGGAFTDVTAAAGLSGAGTGAAAGDYDNDGKPDLAVTGAGGVTLYRNRGDGTFADATTPELRGAGACLGVGWVDVDQDGDLDLLVCRAAGLALFENVGVAPPAPAGGPPPALTTAFKLNDKLAAPGSAVALAFADLDSDKDADLFVLPESGAPVVVENDRLMRFKRPAPAWAAGLSGRWTGALCFDANHDERSDLFITRHDGAPVFLLSKGEADFAPGSTNSPPLKQAVTADVDLDGWPDVIGVTADGRVVLLHNTGDGNLELVAGAFGPVPAGFAAAVADIDGDGVPDLLTWGAAGLGFRRSAGNGNSAVFVAPTGRRENANNMRTNADGIGCWISAQTGSFWTGAERTTTSAGLGQSLLPTVLGLGRHGRADVLRVRWPDAVWQVELGVNGGAVVPVIESNRKPTSCPVLMTWDGERFVFVTDFLGGGALGECGPDGSVRPPRPEESVAIEAGQLVPKDGHYVLKIAEPMDEVLYLDHLRLDVIDRPAGVAVYPDERFVLGPPFPSQALFAFPQKVFPKAATDHRGRDVLSRVKDRDRRAVDGFAPRSWLGYAEEHALELDFGDLPAGRWALVLAGWTEYPYPESMYAATRAGVALSPPVLERFDPATKTWAAACDLGFPAGLPRVMVRELPAPPAGRVRIRTNMQVYWDQVYAAPIADAAAVGRVTPLAVTGASLAARGFMQEILPDGRPPVAYDDAKTEPVAVTRWKGNLTRLGDVTELLAAADDRFVLCGPGDEITARFAAGALPPLPAGWERSFVLRTHGYCKDTSTTTVGGGTVGPLPFRAMPNYPAFGTVPPPATDAARWHTRPAGGGR